MYLLTSAVEFPIHSLNKPKRQQGDSEGQWWIELQPNDVSQSTTVHHLSSGKQTNIKSAMNQHRCIAANVFGLTGKKKQTEIVSVIRETFPQLCALDYMVD